MVVTVVPLIIVGIIAIVFFKVSTPTLFGLLSGSMTDPPALSFANTMLGNDSPAVAYATVYPLVMMLRIVAGQILVILLLG
jgi:putative transport protein